VWLFAAKWGLTVGDKARRKFGFVCLGLAILLVGIGIWTITGFVSTPANQVPYVQHD
jgi:succinate dehydrogenase / fumarate reductase cytochrome b subunit